MSSSQGDVSTVAFVVLAALVIFVLVFLITRKPGQAFDWTASDIANAYDITMLKIGKDSCAADKATAAVNGFLKYCFMVYDFSTFQSKLTSNDAKLIAKLNSNLTAQGCPNVNSMRGYRR